VAPGNEPWIIESSDQVPRAMLLKRFPVPRNFGMAPESRIAQGQTWPAPPANPAPHRGRRRTRGRSRMMIIENDLGAELELEKMIAV